MGFAASKHARFRIMKKMDVNGPEASPLFAWLTDQVAVMTPEAGSGRIGWNFAKVSNVLYSFLTMLSLSSIDVAC